MLALGLASVAAGQETLVSPGERIRVKHACEGDAKPAPCRPVIGKVRAVEGDTIVVDQDGDGEQRLVLGPAAKVELERRPARPCPRRTGPGNPRGCRGGRHRRPKLPQQQLGARVVRLLDVFTVPSGALIGVIAGALTKSEKWRTVKQPTARLELLPAVTPDGVAVAGRVSF